MVRSSGSGQTQTGHWATASYTQQGPHQNMCMIISFKLVSPERTLLVTYHWINLEYLAFSDLRWRKHFHILDRPD